MTQRSLFPDLAEGVRGLPMVMETACQNRCTACAEACPTDAINIFKFGEKEGITLDLGSCINCGLCVDLCPTKTIVNNPTTKVAVNDSAALILTNIPQDSPEAAKAIDKIPLPKASFGSKDLTKAFSFFNRSVAARVVSTGCSACDMEIGASGNPIFDLEHFGVRVVASPRFADALIVTGPVPKGMHGAFNQLLSGHVQPKSSNRTGLVRHLRWRP